MQFLFANARFKPVHGTVLSDSGHYLNNVNIISIPSGTKSKTGELGQFSISIPIGDRALSFFCEGYRSDTVNAILYENKKVITLTKVIEVNYLDSVNTLIRFIVPRDDVSVDIYDTESLLKSGLTTLEHNFIRDNETILTRTIIGYPTFYYKGLSQNNFNVLYNGVRIDHLSFPLMNLSFIGQTGISELVVSKGGYDKNIASSGNFNFFSRLPYTNSLSATSCSNNLNEYNNDLFVSLSIKTLTLNGGFREKKDILPYLNITKNKMITSKKGYFSNIGFTNRKNLELVLMGFQNSESFFNSLNNEKSNLDENNLIVKVDQWNPFTGRISIYGSYEEKNGLNYFQTDSLYHDDDCGSLGFLLEKDLFNFLFTFSSSSSLINSNWTIGQRDLEFRRQNSSFNSSAKVFFNKHDTELYVKNLKMVFSKSRTSDVPDPVSDISMQSGYWDNQSFNISTEIVKPDTERNQSYYFSFGQTYNIPNIQGTILHQVDFSPFNQQKEIYPEKLSKMELKMLISDDYLKYDWSYNFKLSLFQNSIKDKIIYLNYLGNPTLFPVNIGNTSINGLQFYIELEPKVKKVRLSSSLVVYSSSDFSKFLFLPKHSLKNILHINNRYFKLTFISTHHGLQNVNYINQSNQIDSEVYNAQTDYSLQLSKVISFKNSDATFSFISHNINNSRLIFNQVNFRPRSFEMICGINLN